MGSKSFFMESLIVQKRNLLKLSIYSLPLSFLFVFGVDAIFNERSSYLIPVFMMVGCLFSPLLVSFLYKTLIEAELGYHIDSISYYMILKSFKLSLLYIAVGLVGVIAYNIFGESYIADLLFFNPNDIEREKAIKGIYQSINIASCAILMIMISNIMGFINSMLILSNTSFSSLRNRLKRMYEDNKELHKHQKKNHNSFIYPIMLSIMFPFILVLIKIIKAKFFGEELDNMPDISYLDLTIKDKIFLVIIYAFSVVPNVITNNFIVIKDCIEDKDF